MVFIFTNECTVCPLKCCLKKTKTRSTFDALARYNL